MTIKLLIMTIIALVLAGCAPSRPCVSVDDVNALRYDVRVLEHRVDSLYKMSVFERGF